MPSAKFELDIPAAFDAATCWKVLTDVPRLASWVTVIGDVMELSWLEHYRAVLLDRLGPFKLKADLDVTVSEVKNAEHIRVQAVGEDRQVSSRIGIDATLVLEPQPSGGTAIEIVGTYEVVGRVATLGAGMIRQKADKIIDEFTQHATEALGSR